MTLQDFTKVKYNNINQFTVAFIFGNELYYIAKIKNYIVK